MPDCILAKRSGIGRIVQMERGLEYWCGDFRTRLGTIGRKRGLQEGAT
jgi:hypothetical protein